MSRTPSRGARRRHQRHGHKGPLSYLLAALALAQCTSRRSAGDASIDAASHANTTAGRTEREAAGSPERAFVAGHEHGHPHDDAGAGDASQLRLRGIPAGYLRIVHLAPAVGRLRFVATNAPNYNPSRVEAVLSPGESSGYLFTIAVPHRIDVYPLDANPDAGAPLVSTPLVDVYNGKGCTAALVGVPPVRPARRGRGVAPALDPRLQLRIARVVDLSRRSPPGRAFVRFFHAVEALGDDVRVREADAIVAEGLSFGDVTGVHEITAGTHRFVLVPSESERDAGALARALDVPEQTLPEGAPRTVWIYGRPTEPALHALLTEDAPPRTPPPEADRP